MRGAGDPDRRRSRLRIATLTVVLLPLAVLAEELAASGGPPLDRGYVTHWPLWARCVLMLVMSWLGAVAAERMTRS